MRALFEDARVEFHKVQKQLRQIEHDHHPMTKNRPTDSLIHFGRAGEQTPDSSPLGPNPFYSNPQLARFINDIFGDP
jgi:hypothetical protein